MKYTLSALACVVLATWLLASPLTAGPSQPGTNFRDCTDCPDMVVIPGGSFVMGAPKDEPGFFVIEGPQHKVTVPAFAMGKFDVTRGQWQSFVTASKRVTKLGCAWTPDMKNAAMADWRHPGFDQDDLHPVVCVNWNDAQDYVAWLTAKTGRKYRLPSEAEWEYAARGGSTTAYPWGAVADHDHANYGNTQFQTLGFKSGRDQWQFTSPVGSFPANAFGLHDMNGNVLQWVQDCFSPSYDGLPVDGSAYTKSVPVLLPTELRDMTIKTSCDMHMMRGGDWNDPADMIRSAFRNFGSPPDYPNGATGGAGFRVAAQLD